MKYLKLKGGTKKSRKLAEKYLDKLDFEKLIFIISSEVLLYGIPYEETPSYKQFMKIIKRIK